MNANQRKLCNKYRRGWKKSTHFRNWIIVLTNNTQHNHISWEQLEAIKVQPLSIWYVVAYIYTQGKIKHTEWHSDKIKRLCKVQKSLLIISMQLLSRYIKFSLKCSFSLKSIFPNSASDVCHFNFIKFVSFN